MSPNRSSMSRKSRCQAVVKQDRVTMNSSEDEERITLNDTTQEGSYDQQHAQLSQDEDAPLVGPSLHRTLSNDSIVSTDSAPPPYEQNLSTGTPFGRIQRWLKQRLRFRRRQAIALPVLPLRRPQYFSHGSLSSLSMNSYASSTFTPGLFPPLSSRLHFPRPPKFTLPPLLGRLRGLLLCLSFLGLLVFSFLLFCTIFFSPASLTPSQIPDKTTDTDVRFLTLNVMLRPPGITNNWSDYKDERLDYIIRYILPHYDVVAFQGAYAFATRRKDRLIQRAMDLGFNHHVESPRHFPWDFGVDGGLLLLSRFPIRQANTMEYPRGIHSDWLAYKGALHATIDLNATRSVHVYATDTQASYGTPSQADVQIRHSQFMQLHQLIKDTAERDAIPIVVMGGLNVNAADPNNGIPSPSNGESSDEYKAMLSTLSATVTLTDALYDAYGYHPVTFGDAEKNDQGQWQPTETVLTDEDQQMSLQSIDTILWSPQRTSIRVTNAKVEKFMVKNNSELEKGQRDSLPFTQVSDHYGVSCVVELV